MRRLVIVLGLLLLAGCSAQKQNTAIVAELEHGRGRYVTKFDGSYLLSKYEYAHEFGKMSSQQYEVLPTYETGELQYKIVFHGAEGANVFDSPEGTADIQNKSFKVYSRRLTGAYMLAKDYADTSYHSYSIEPVIEDGLVRAFNVVLHD